MYEWRFLVAVVVEGSESFSRLFTIFLFLFLKNLYSKSDSYLHMILLTRTRDDQSPPIKNRKQHRDIPSCRVCNPSSRPGKVHGSVLPQEYELERLVADVLHPDPSWTTSTAACNWARV